WRFLGFEEEAARRPAEVRELLDVSSALGLKVLRLSPLLRRATAGALLIIGVLLVGGLIGILGGKAGLSIPVLGALGGLAARGRSRGCSALGFWLLRFSSAPVAGWCVAVLIVALAALAGLVRFADARPGRLARRILRAVLGGAIGLVAWIFARAYVALVDP